MTSISWWRSWHGAPTDHKWAVIAARAGVKVGIVSAVAWALMDHASQAKERGSVADFDTEVYAVYSGFDEAEIIAIIKAMTDKGIIVDGMLANWTKRQPQREDDSRDRVRQWREMKRNVTQSNTEISPDTDTDTDKDTDKREVVARITSLYSENFTPITPMTKDELVDLCNDFEESWIVDAMQEAVKQNKRNIKYFTAILDRWKIEGKDSDKPKKNGVKPSSKQDKRDEMYALLQEDK